ncbi:MAG TPA: DUF2092 domain-containing protein, partial [Pseudolabrys sp.]|nr:DUF2092 domain-containing protein [Pseudolabrys sp.]
MRARFASLAAGVIALGLAGWVPGASAADANHNAEPGIGKAAAAAIADMGKTLSAKDFSFKVQTIRVYQDGAGDFLHVVHHMDVVVARPDRLSVSATGDDGSTRLVYDGKAASLVN